jgi:hypothetical protein
MLAEYLGYGFYPGSIACGKNEHRLEAYATLRRCASGRAVEMVSA